MEEVEWYDEDHDDCLIEGPHGHRIEEWADVVFKETDLNG